MWKPDTGKEAGEFLIPGIIQDDGAINVMALSPDGKLLLAETVKGHISLSQFPFPPASDRPAE